MLEPTVVGGRYRLLERIGAGAMGAVFRAEHIATRQVVAVKELLLPTGLDDATIRALRSRFALEREIGLVAAGHALLVPCIDYVDDAGREFIVMEHVSEGTTLREFILKQRRLAPSQVLRLFVQLASGVAFLHGCHFVCRDIKPSNIFVVRDGAIATPKRDHFVLPGITLDVVAELARTAGIPFDERDITEADVRAADELWLASSTREVLAITSLDGRPVGIGMPGPMYRRMITLFQQHKRARRP